MNLVILSILCLCLPALQMSLDEYAHLEETSPQLLFAPQNLDNTENHPKL